MLGMLVVKFEAPKEDQPRHGSSFLGLVKDNTKNRLNRLHYKPLFRTGACTSRLELKD